MTPRRAERIALGFMVSGAFLALAILFFIIAVIMIKGLPHVTLRFLLDNPMDMGRAGGIFSTIVSTIYLLVVSLIIAIPLGVGTAIYLTEYTVEGKVTKIIRFGTECLAGVPSIILGLFGFILFVVKMGFSWCVLSGGISLAIMILPVIIRTSEEAIKAVPQSYRDVNEVLGGSKWQGVIRLVLPNAAPGILTGIILSVGRGIGETAVVIFTLGTSLRTPFSIFDSGRSMAVHFYILAQEGISMKNAYATAAVLVFSILIINIFSYYMMHRFVKGRT